MVNWLDQSWRDVRFAIRGLAAHARVHGAGGHVARARHHGHHRHLQRAARGRARSVSLQGRRQPDERPRLEPRAARGFRTGYSVDQFLEIAERNTIFDGVDRVDDQRRALDRRRRSAAAARQPRHVQHVRRDGRSAAPRPDAERRAMRGRARSRSSCWATGSGSVSSAAIANVLGRQLRLNDTVRTVIGVMPKRFMWRGADVYLPITFERGRVIEGVAERAPARPAEARRHGRAGGSRPDADHRGSEEARADSVSRPVARRSAVVHGDVPERDQQRHLGAVRRRRAAAADRLRQRLEPAAVAGRRAAARDDRARRARRQPPPAGAAAADREPDPRAGRRRARHGARLRRPAGASSRSCRRARFRTNPKSRSTPPVLVFALLVSAATSVICGLAPALHSIGRDLAGSMREAGRGLAGSSRQAILRKALVVGEVALSLMLLAGSSVLLRTFVAMQNVELGVARRADADDARAAAAAAVSGCRATDRVLSGAAAASARRAGRRGRGAEHRPAPARQHVDRRRRRGRRREQRTGAWCTMSMPTTRTRWAFGSRPGGCSPTATSTAASRSRSSTSGSSAHALNGRPPLGQIVTLPRLKRAAVLVAHDAFQIVGVVHDTLNEGLAEPVDARDLPAVHRRRHRRTCSSSARMEIRRR